MSIPSRALRCFPADDAEFCGRVDRVAVTIEADRPPDWIAERLRDWLRDWYPKADVVPQHELASVSGEHAWYVYRDGRPLRRRSNA